MTYTTDNAAVRIGWAAGTFVVVLRTRPHAGTAALPLAARQAQRYARGSRAAADTQHAPAVRGGHARCAARSSRLALPAQKQYVSGSPGLRRVHGSVPRRRAYWEEPRSRRRLRQLLIRGFQCEAKQRGSAPRRGAAAAQRLVSHTRWGRLWPRGGGRGGARSASERHGRTLLTAAVKEAKGWGRLRARAAKAGPTPDGGGRASDKGDDMSTRGARCHSSPGGVPVNPLIPPRADPSAYLRGKAIMGGQGRDVWPST